MVLSDPLEGRGGHKGTLQLAEQIAECGTRVFGIRPQNMRNYPYFLECSSELNATGWCVADNGDAEAVVAEQTRRLSPEGAVGFQLPVEHRQRFGATVDFNGDGVLPFANTDEEEQVGHDLQLGGAELLAQLPVGQGPFQLETGEPCDGDPGLDDGEVVFEAAAGNAASRHPLVGEVGLPGRTQAVDVLLALFGRQDGQVLAVEESPETNRGGVPPYAGKGVRDEVRRPGQSEPREGMQDRSVTLGELHGDVTAASMAELAAGGLSHGRSGFLTGSPQVGHGV